MRAVVEAMREGSDGRRDELDIVYQKPEQAASLENDCSDHPSAQTQSASPTVPHWPSCDLKERTTMIFDLETGDTETRVEKDPRGAERVFAAGAHYRQPGT